MKDDDDVDEDNDDVDGDDDDAVENNIDDEETENFTGFRRRCSSPMLIVGFVKKAPEIVSLPSSYLHSLRLSVSLSLSNAGISSNCRQARSSTTANDSRGRENGGACEQIFEPSGVRERPRTGRGKRVVYEGH